MIEPKKYKCVVTEINVSVENFPGLVFSSFCDVLDMGFTFPMDFMPLVKENDHVVLEVSEAGICFYPKQRAQG
jgi:hypothetical protein